MFEEVPVQMYPSFPYLCFKCTNTPKYKPQAQVVIVDKQTEIAYRVGKLETIKEHIRHFQVHRTVERRIESLSLTTNFDHWVLHELSVIQREMNVEACVSLDVNYYG